MGNQAARPPPVFIPDASRSSRHPKAMTHNERRRMRFETRFDRLEFEGRSPTSVDYMALRARHAELVRAGRAVEQARDDANSTARQLSDELAALERQRGGGADVTAKITKAAIRVLELPVHAERRRHRDLAGICQ